ncbi:MAG: hypothetical protein ACOY45_06200 [Pseudomonadota bacterium]
MMKAFMLGAALLVSTPVAARQDASANPAATAAAVAEAMQPNVGQDFGGGITIAKVHADKSTIVIQVSGPNGWTANMSAEQASGYLVQGFCQEAPEFFKSGVSMRVDTIDNGATRKGPLVSSCGI